ncbi:MAG: hypothetical protein JWN52_7093, partial [Actinomycetia bacterium]|nr:hypothetical protein [Actinomycetes bacterium]
MGVAARVAGWQRRMSGLPAPTAPAGQVTRTETIELLLGGQWVDITTYVYTRDKITITRGRADEARQTDPSTCHLTINNISGRFSPRNPVGPYYGLIGRNTPIRVSVDQDGTKRYRFHGEVSSWPQKWNLAATDAYVPVEASGILRRLNQGSTPLNSTMYRGVTSALAAANLVAYWPCEDLAGSASISAATAATRPMTVTGTPTFASSTTFDASTALPDIGTSKWTGTVPGYTNATTDPTNILDGNSSQEVKFLLSVPTAGTTANAVLMSVLSTGSLRRYDIVYTSTGVHIKTYDSDDTLISDTVQNDVDGTPGYAGVQLIQGPFGQPSTTVNGSFAWYGIGASSSSTGGFNAATQTCGRITTVIVNPNRSDLTGVVIGHITVHNIIQDAFVLSDQLQAFVGETAGDR